MKYPLLALIKLYQWIISPFLGPVCKYYPSCSHYGFTAIDRHGAIKGTALTAWRILRCNPWSRGGVAGGRGPRDPPPRLCLPRAVRPPRVVPRPAETPSPAQGA
nr:membrane protein insertion efficiency factor YidD [Streptomyces sp. NEAU-H3]